MMRYGLCSVDPLHIRLDDLRLSEVPSADYDTGATGELEEDREQGHAKGSIPMIDCLGIRRTPLPAILRKVFKIKQIASYQRRKLLNANE